MRVASSDISAKARGNAIAVLFPRLHATIRRDDVRWKDHSMMIQTRSQMASSRCERCNWRIELAPLSVSALAFRCIVSPSSLARLSYDVDPVCRAPETLGRQRRVSSLHLPRHTTRRLQPRRHHAQLLDRTRPRRSHRCRSRCRRRSIHVPAA